MARPLRVLVVFIFFANGVSSAPDKPLQLCEDTTSTVAEGKFLGLLVLYAFYLFVLGSVL